MLKIIDVRKGGAGADIFLLKLEDDKGNRYEGYTSIYDGQNEEDIDAKIEDLKEDVSRGYITEERAKEIYDKELNIIDENGSIGIDKAINFINNNVMDELAGLDDEDILKLFNAEREV